MGVAGNKIPPDDIGALCTLITELTASLDANQAQQAALFERIFVAMQALQQDMRWLASRQEGAWRPRAWRVLLGGFIGVGGAVGIGILALLGILGR